MSSIVELILHKHVEKQKPEKKNLNSSDSNSKKVCLKPTTACISELGMSKKCWCSWKIAGWHHATAPRSHAEALVWTRQSACLASGECQGTCHCRISIDSTSRCWWNSWAQQWREILGATVHTFSGTGEIFQIGLTTSSVFHKVDRGGEVSKASDHLWLSRSSQRSNILRF